MISCKEASYLVDKQQVSGIPIIAKFRLKIHLMLCKCCTKYLKDWTFISKVLLRMKIDVPKLSAEDKSKMKEKIYK